MELQDRRIRIVPQRLDIRDCHWVAPETPDLGFVDINGSRERIVPVYSFCGAFQGNFPEKYRWDRMVGAAMEDHIEIHFAFLWYEHDKTWDDDARRWVWEWMKDPYVFAALVGLEIE